MLSHMNNLVFQFFSIIFIKMWVFYYKHMGTMCEMSNYIHKVLLNTRGTASIVFLGSDSDFVNVIPLDKQRAPSSPPLCFSVAVVELLQVQRSCLPLRLLHMLISFSSLPFWAFSWISSCCYSLPVGSLTLPRAHSLQPLLLARAESLLH